MFTTLVALLSIVSLAAASPLPEARSLHERYSLVQIQSHRNGECLVPEGAKWGNGFQVITKPCEQAAWWDINPGSGSILLSGSTMALDAGTGTENNEIVKIWESYPGLFQQTWYLTPDNRIAITGGDQCLDQGDNGPQTYQCTTGNTNQVWYLIGGAGSGSTTTLPADGSATTAVSSSVSSEPITSTAEISILTDSPTATGTAST
ncbi:hypothetical protein C356_05235 [Cryptococcus neoformans c45]|nr:hypothetical protein C356_05235 [Cryptococcus neoformans var. grubii c45]